MGFNITHAKREQLTGSIALMGASGSGKTLSALKIAKGMIGRKYPDMDDAERWEKVGYIDTEHERSKIYADNSRHGIGSFSHIDFQKPYSLDRYDDAIKALKDYGCEIIITDSLSHFWEGDGGILDLQQSFGGTFQAWRETNPHYNNFVSLVTGERHGLDMLNCVRTKQAYEVSTNEIGKLKVEKLGLKPVQRDSLEYEFHIVFQIDMEHNAITVKDNSEIFKDIPRVIESKAGEDIHDWLKEGVDVASEQSKLKEEEDKEKDDVINIIHSYLEVEDKEFNKYVRGLIAKSEQSANGDIHNFPLERLHGFVKLLSEKHEELEKPQQEEEEDKTVSDLKKIAKNLGIERYNKMKKAELQEAITKEQG